MARKLFDFFLFSSLYIAFCAVIMVQQTAQLFLYKSLPAVFYYFVFFSTVCSYNFHWWLSTHSTTGSERLTWATRHKKLHFILYAIGLVGCMVCFFLLRQHWFWIGVGAFVTFLYSAPKIPQKIFTWLKKIAVGKTVFLAFVWMYVTTLLPFFISGRPLQTSFIWFACGRFFLIYAICILFDYRDREDDKADGIRSMITWFNEKGINRLFAGSLSLFALSTIVMNYYGVPTPVIAILMVPGAVVALLYNYAKKHFSDYLYYFVLDGLMMLSAVLMLLLQI